MDIQKMILELEQTRDKITAAINALMELESSRQGTFSAGTSPELSRSGKPPSPNEKPAKKRQLSAEGRRRIVEAAKKRWARHHKLQKKPRR